jgi:cytoskeletal protein CcmA (bactofilin family)
VVDKKQGSEELSLVGTGTTIEGKISTEGSIRIDGKLIGEVKAKANAAIGSTGNVEGSITAKNVSVSGRVKGTVTVSEKLILEGKSVMQGDVRAARLVIDEGAMFDGRCSMSGHSPQAPTPPHHE